MNPNLISPIDEFTHLLKRTYKIEGELIDVYCYGYIGKIIDGDYAIYVSFKYGLLADASLNWGARSLLIADEPKTKNLIKKLRKDRSFFIYPNFDEKNSMK